jgi:ADP-ribose 1''-phosphate phosphatase
MSQVSYLKQSLFDVPEREVIIHACNAQGVWGSGIAAEFKKRYPDSLKDYQDYCDSGEYVVGKGKLSRFSINEKHWVGWIITSNKYGKDKDPKEVIKAQTALALHHLCHALYTSHPRSYNPEIVVYSNKFNSGLFGVPWEETETILKVVLSHFKRIKWVVCDPNHVGG